MKKNYLLLLITIFISAWSFGQNAGDIIITEIMQNPLYPINDSEAEYFEVYNTTAVDIDLNGWSITDNNVNAHTIASSLIVPANGFVVLGINSDTAVNGGVTIDYVYDNVALGNSSDALILTTAGGTEIDRVEWDNGATFPDPNGHSMNLDSAQFDGTANDDGTNWCESTTAMGTQFGTPGAANETCAAPCLLSLGARTSTCDATTAGTDTYTTTIDYTGGADTTYTITVSSGTLSGDDPTSTADGTITISGVSEGTNLTVDVTGGTCTLSATITSPICIPSTCEPVGSVIITEIMQNPLDPINDSEAEWFELYNTTAADIDLSGWSIVDDNNTSEGFTIPSTLIIPANGYLLFANNGDPATNGGLPTPDFVYTNGFPYLGNGTDGLTVQCSGTIIDIVVWDNGATFPDPNGASMSLDIAHLNATDNDNGVNWIEETTFTYGPTSQFGTPGGPNNVQLSVSNEEIEGFSFYPNPVNNGKLFINTLNNSTKNVELFSILGKRVLSNTFNKNISIDVANLNSGLYLLKVTDGEKTSVRKVIIK